MSTLYLSNPAAVLSKSYEAFTVSVPDENGKSRRDSVPAQTINQVVILGSAQITTEALVYALELGISVHYLTGFGRYLGSLMPAISRNGTLRLAQYELYNDQTRRLEIVKRIVIAKIHNQAAVLYRHGVRDHGLLELKKKVENQESIDGIRGIEGMAAKNYFSLFGGCIKGNWSFSGRSRRPPTDPVNAMLSFAYGLLRSQVSAAVHVVGLDPFVGFLHEPHHGQPALVLDLMENFRPLIADNLVLSLLNRQQIKPEDFENSLEAFRLNDRGRRVFLEEFDHKMKDEFKHPVFDYKCSYRRSIELQARLLSRSLQENIIFQPLVLR
ncbi:MAG: type I-D CRISPR-associated endonuclease Cas1d [Pseudanabaenaceae cyanobacterium SKYGB_i_bin29]|nr:type I-D CRISPR-associated endonuclease Cas1d [Pseudanabaenaceae cyanobacterium SKYG29]MDW8420998.1 type I-D CRISPR-associated endonuclease Cas1d [Pseudanabaenaceae cyanobacterium SKYGB_i_bin29]